MFPVEWVIKASVKVGVMPPPPPPDLSGPTDPAGRLRLVGFCHLVLWFLFFSIRSLQAKLPPLRPPPPSETGPPSVVRARALVVHELQELQLYLQRGTQMKLPPPQQNIVESFWMKCYSGSVCSERGGGPAAASLFN